MKIQKHNMREYKECKYKRGFGICSMQCYFSCKRNKINIEFPFTDFAIFICWGR